MTSLPFPRLNYQFGIFHLIVTTGMIEVHMRIDQITHLGDVYVTACQPGTKFFASLELRPKMFGDNLRPPICRVLQVRLQSTIEQRLALGVAN